MLLRAVIAGLDVAVDGFAGGIPDGPPRHPEITRLRRLRRESATPDQPRGLARPVGQSRPPASGAPTISWRRLATPATGCTTFLIVIDFISNIMLYTITGVHPFVADTLSFTRTAGVAWLDA
jgi:hypothetical protein